MTYKEETNLFITALRTTLKQKKDTILNLPPKQPEGRTYLLFDDVGEGPRSEEEVEEIRKKIALKDPNATLRYVPNNYTPPIPNNNYSNEHCELPDYPQDLKDNLLDIFFDYENNMDRASNLRFTEDYSCADLIDDLRFDLFAWVASELLFKKPEEYTKGIMSLFYDFENKAFDGKSCIKGSERMPCSDKDWERFTKKRCIITDRIKSFPMPPHFLWVYSSSTIKTEEGRYKTKTGSSYKFFFKNDAYESLGLEDYLNLEDKIHSDIIGAQHSMYTKYSELLNFLIKVYIERVYGFKHMINEINIVAEYCKLGYDATIKMHSVYISRALKSNELYYTKFALNRLLENGDIKFNIVKAVLWSFQGVARDILDAFSEAYNKKYERSPKEAFSDIFQYTKLLDVLSITYEELFSEYKSRKSHEATSSRIDELSMRERQWIMKHIAQPSSFFDANVIGSFNDDRFLNYYHPYLQISEE